MVTKTVKKKVAPKKVAPKKVAPKKKGLAFYNLENKYELALQTIVALEERVKELTKPVSVGQGKLDVPSEKENG